MGEAESSCFIGLQLNPFYHFLKKDTVFGIEIVQSLFLSLNTLLRCEKILVSL
jgi:hypothetical protein